MAETLLEELKRYLDWSAADEAALRALHPWAKPEYSAIADAFYARILEHEGARRVLDVTGHEIHKLQNTLVGWLERLLQGPWDEDYFALRCAIGRAHVRIALPQHYMFGAMGLVRTRLHEIAERAQPWADSPRGHLAIDRALDLELAIMLHAYREDLLAQQARTERLGTFGQLVGSIGHELRNPLGVIETSLYLIGARLPEGDERLAKHVGRIGEQLRLANGIITNMLDIIRDRPMAKERVVLADVITSAVSALKQTDGASIELRGASPEFVLQADAVALRQVFVNLLDNARQAAGPDGNVQVDISVDTTADEAAFIVAIEDDGPGVDAGIARRLFEPLMTTKRTGIGLGLALVKRLVERHGGTVAYAPGEEAGARFVVRLPVGGQ